MHNPYWRRMEFEPAVLTIVRAALKTKMWQGSEAEKLEKLLALNRALSVHYGVPTCTVSISQTPIGPHYKPGADLIVLDKVSLVSYLHELGHHLLHHRRKPQQEEFPRAFSLSLFFKAAPRMFEAARSSGRLLFTEQGGIDA